MHRFALRSLTALLVLGAFGPNALGEPEAFDFERCQSFHSLTEAERHDLALLADGTVDFSLSLLKELATADGNLFFSPTSIATALAMTYAGADGDTATAMAKGLRLQLTGDRLNKAYGNFLADLSCNENQAFELHVANALFAQQGYGFRDEYVRQVVTNYDSTPMTVDFAGSPNKARQTINDWAASKTNDRIKELVAPSMLTQATRLVLANAIYYKASWLYEFRPEQTSEQEFTTGAGDTVRAPFMHQKHMLAYMENESLQMVELPFLAEDNSSETRQSLLVLLPKPGIDVNETIAALDAASLRSLRAQLASEYVALALPKFRFATGLNLGHALSALGMETAFLPGVANFSRMTKAGEEPLHLDGVAHKAFIDLNEKGVEAAAATAALVASYSLTPEPLKFVADRPFLFVIWDEPTATPLFIGRLNTPEL